MWLFRKKAPGHCYDVLYLPQSGMTAIEASYCAIASTTLFTSTDRVAFIRSNLPNGVSIERHFEITERDGNKPPAPLDQRMK